MMQVSLSRGPKRRGISLSSTPQKQPDASFYDPNKISLSAQPQKNCIHQQSCNTNQTHGFRASSANCQPVATINIATPNTVYYVQSKQNVSFSYSQASSQKNQPLTQSVMLDRKINELQNQIAQKHDILKQIKNTSQINTSPGKKIIEVTQNKIHENSNNFKQEKPISHFSETHNALSSISPNTKINVEQNRSYANVNVAKKVRQFNPTTKFQAIQISPMPILSEQKNLHFKQEMHQQSELSIVNHQESGIQMDSVYSKKYKILLQQRNEDYSKNGAQRSQQHFFNVRNTQQQVQKPFQKINKSPSKKKSKTKEQSTSKDINIKLNQTKQNVKLSRPSLDLNKIKFMESKLLDIIKVCQQGL